MIGFGEVPLDSRCEGIMISPDFTYVTGLVTKKLENPVALQLWCSSLRGHLPCTKFFAGFEKKHGLIPSVETFVWRVGTKQFFLCQNWVRNILMKRSIWWAYMATILWHPKCMLQYLEFVYETWTSVN